MSGYSEDLRERIVSSVEEGGKSKAQAARTFSLRKVAARTKEALVEAIGAALCAISAQDARGFFEHAGYRPTGQLL